MEVELAERIQLPTLADQMIRSHDRHGQVLVSFLGVKKGEEDAGCAVKCLS